MDLCFSIYGFGDNNRLKSFSVLFFTWTPQLDWNSTLEWTCVFFSIYRFDDTIYTCVGSSTVPYVTSIGNTLLDVRLSKPCSVMTKNDLELPKSTINVPHGCRV